MAAQLLLVARHAGETSRSRCRCPMGAARGAIVLARDGTPLRAFADRDGVWRYPASLDRVSPLYLQALIGYEDRWFWQASAASTRSRCARRRAVGAAWARGVGRFDADDAGRAHPRSAATGASQRGRQDAADGARAATGSASVEARDPRAVPGSRAVRRHDRRRRGGELGVSRQAGVAACRMRKRRCSSCCRSRRAACGRTANPNAPASHATRCLRAWRRKACGRAATCATRASSRSSRVRSQPPRHAALLAQRLRDASPGVARIRSTHRHRSAAHAGRARCRVLLRSAAAHVGGAAGRRQRDAGGAGLRRFGRVRRSRSASATSTW